MSDIQVFNNEQFGSIRTAGTADNPMFCLADICKVLELRVDGVMPRLKEGGVQSNWGRGTNWNEERRNTSHSKRGNDFRQRAEPLQSYHAKRQATSRAFPRLGMW